MRNSWTDDRLDDFAAHTEHRFDRLEYRFDRIEDRLERMEGRMNEQFGRLDARIDQLGQMMFRTMVGLIVTMALGFASLIVTGG